MSYFPGFWSIQKLWVKDGGNGKKRETLAKGDFFSTFSLPISDLDGWEYGKMGEIGRKRGKLEKVVQHFAKRITEKWKSLHKYST